MRPIISIVVFMMVCGVRLEARECLVLEYQSVSEARNEIFKRLNHRHYLNFLALDFDRDDFRMLANELLRAGIERKLQSTDIGLADAIHPEFLSRVYRIYGKPCYWKCDLFIILVDKIDASHVSVRVVPAFPMASIGRVFNIHTFTFTRNWQPVAGAASDMLPLLNHLAGLFQKPAIEDVVPPSAIELK